MSIESVRRGARYLIQPVARIFRVVFNRDPSPDERRQHAFNAWKWRMGLGKKMTAESRLSNVHPGRIAAKPVPQEKTDAQPRPNGIYPRRAKAALAAKATEIRDRKE